MQRRTPEKLAYYEVLMRRGHDTAEYAKLYAQIKSGYIGERRLDREWKDINVSGLLLHDFTCFNLAGHTHQMDTIFVCKHFVLVVEAKNVTGRIDFNPQTRQLIRRREDGVIEAFTSPIDQVKRHKTLLENHFMTHADFVPIEAAVVITNPNCLIGNTGTDIPMFAVNGLKCKLEELIARHQHVTLNMRQIRESLEQLYRPHTAQPWRKDVPVRTGVLCLTCNGKMLLQNRGYKCFRCNIFDSNDLAIRKTLYDYRTLYGEEITNRQFRAFAEIKSRHTAYSMLSRILKNCIENGRGSKFIIPENVFEPEKSNLSYKS